MDYLRVALDNAAKDREALRGDMAKLGVKVAALKAERAELLLKTELQGDSLEVQQVNVKLHNARRVMEVLRKKREHLDFLLNYFGAEESNNEEEGLF